jgi:hypothetical protein
MASWAGQPGGKNWNAEILPGPNEVGFDYSFIFPATADRVPTVFMENHRVMPQTQQILFWLITKIK